MSIIDDIEYIEAKTLLTKNKYKEKWFGADYNLNIYRGCSHGCIYCDSRSDCYRIENFDKALERLMPNEDDYLKILKQNKPNIAMPIMAATSRYGDLF